MFFEVRWIFAGGWGPFILGFCSPGPGDSSGSPEQVAQRPQAASDLVPVQTYHPASAVQAGPTFLPSTTQVSQLVVRVSRPPEGAGRVRGRVRGAAPLHAEALRFLLLESCLALLPEETEEEDHTWTRDVHESMDSGAVYHVWATGRPYHTPGPGHLIGILLQGTWQLWQMLWGCCLPGPGQTPRRRGAESQGAAASCSPMSRGLLTQELSPHLLTSSVGRWVLHHSHHLGKPPESPCSTTKRNHGTRSPCITTRE